jgi:hypothetical protein
MAEPSLQLGNGNWAGKSSSLLAYHKVDKNFYADELTFTRASTGTIVNSDGLIEQVPYNLLEQSNTFDTTWARVNTSITSGQSGYDGSSSAWLLEKTLDNSRYIGQSISSSGFQTFSIYLKKGTTNWVRLLAYGSIENFAYFDLGNGVVGQNNNLISSSISDAGNGFYRCSITYNHTISTVRIYPATGDGNLSGGLGDNIYIQGAQLVSGSIAKPYFPTTTRLNVPRIDYLNNAKGSLLLEPQRTNLLTYSEDFSNAIWTNTGGAISVDPTADSSPDNTLSGNQFNEGTSSGRRAVFEDISVTANQSYTLSVFVKKETLDNFRIVIGYSGTDWTAVEVNLSDNSLTVGDGDNNTFTSISSSISSNDYNGYYKLALTATHPIATSLRLLFCTADGTSIASSNSYGRPDYVGTGETVFVWGCGFELGSYASSYIPTSGTTVTRIADASITNGLSSSINSEAGVFYAELQNDALGRVSLSDGTYNNHILIQLDDNVALVNFKIAGVGNSISGTGFSGFNKIAIKWDATSMEMYLNGVLIGTNVTGSTFAPNTLNSLRFTRGDSNVSGQFFGQCNGLLVYKTTLTNSQLIQLTTI